MATAGLQISATSNAGTTRTVEVQFQGGRMVGTFRRRTMFGDTIEKDGIQIAGDYSRLVNFASRQPGMFIGWVDKKLGVKK